MIFSLMLRHEFLRSLIVKLLVLIGKICRAGKQYYLLGKRVVGCYASVAEEISQPSFVEFMLLEIGEIPCAYLLAE